MFLSKSLWPPGKNNANGGNKPQQDGNGICAFGDGDDLTANHLSEPKSVPTPDHVSD